MARCLFLHPSPSASPFALRFQSSLLPYHTPPLLPLYTSSICHTSSKSLHHPMAQSALVNRSLRTTFSSHQFNLHAASNRKVLLPHTAGLRLHFVSINNLSCHSSPLRLPGTQKSLLGGVKTFALFGTKNAKSKKVATTKPKEEKVEDGIFGTSGGIGFTKQNELFVGRVAMIGFAASLLGEAITGKGILAQFDLETGIPLYETEPLLLFFILFTLLGAIGALGDRGKFVDDPVEPTGLNKAVISPGKGLKPALGLPEKGPTFGFTKANELFVGRLAQLGIAFSIIGEIITGKGALAQLNIETGVPITDIEPLVLLNVLFFFVAAINPGTGKFVTDQDIED